MFDELNILLQGKSNQKQKQMCNAKILQLISLILYRCQFPKFDKLTKCLVNQVPDNDWAKQGVDAWYFLQVSTDLALKSTKT